MYEFILSLCFWHFLKTFSFCFLNYIPYSLRCIIFAIFAPIRKKLNLSFIHWNMAKYSCNTKVKFVNAIFTKICENFNPNPLYSIFLFILFLYSVMYECVAFLFKLYTINNLNFKFKNSLKIIINELPHPPAHIQDFIIPPCLTAGQTYQGKGLGKL